MDYREKHEVALSASNFPAIFAERLDIALTSGSEPESLGLSYGVGYTRNSNPHRAQLPSSISVDLSGNPLRVGDFSFCSFQQFLEPVLLKGIGIGSIFEETHSGSAGYTQWLSRPI
jgi:hypothetical protein